MSCHIIESKNLVGETVHDMYTLMVYGGIEYFDRHIMVYRREKWLTCEKKRYPILSELGRTILMENMVPIDVLWDHYNKEGN